MAEAVEGVGWMIDVDVVDFGNGAEEIAESVGSVDSQIAT